MSQRAAKLILVAAKRTQSYIEALPPETGPKVRANCLNIAAVCEKLLNLRPPRRPTAPSVAEEGRIHFSEFPSRQTLDNKYGKLLQIWREVYQELLDMSASGSKLEPMNAALARGELAALDEGTRARVMLMQAVLRETMSQVNNLKNLIRTRIPLDGASEASLTARGPKDRLAPDLLAELRGFLRGLESGVSPFDSDELGLRISRRAMPGNVVLSRRLVETLREIANDSPSPQ